MTLDDLKQYRRCYLATPYSLYDKGLNAAFKESSRIAGLLAQRGINVFCPIALAHPMSAFSGIDPKDHDFWMARDEPWMEVCEALVVARMQGWQNSRGVGAEIDIFEKADKPVFFLNPVTMELD